MDYENIFPLPSNSRSLNITSCKEERPVIISKAIQSERKEIKSIRRKLKKNKRPKFNEFKNIVGYTGSVLEKDESNLTTMALKKILIKERRKYRQITSKRGTKVKKLVLEKGGNMKLAMQEKNKFIEKEKEDLKRMMLKLQLHALQELIIRFNI